MRRKQNVIIFSAGESVKNGTVSYIEEKLNRKDILCYDYRSLFKNAHDAENIALLPSLTKKIPSFDFAIIIAEDVDRVMLRGNIEKASMRDNVLFELGLCIMGLGVDRVILLAEESVRIPEDLLGATKGRLGVDYLTFKLHELDDTIESVSRLIESKEELFTKRFSTQIDDIIKHIYVNADIISPVFIGAAVSSAEAYFQNFIIRLLENIDKEFCEENDYNRKFTFPKNTAINIIIPKKLTSLSDNVKKYYSHIGCRCYVIRNARFRSLSFNGIIDENNNSMTIVDIPTSITASYSVVNSVLNIDSDEDYDHFAEERFVNKEIDVYAFALSKLLTPSIASERLSFVKEPERKEMILAKIADISISVRDIACE